MQHLQAISYVLQTKDLQLCLSLLDATYKKAGGGEGTEGVTPFGAPQLAAAIPSSGASFSSHTSRPIIAGCCNVSAVNERPG